MEHTTNGTRGSDSQKALHPYWAYVTYDFIGDSSDIEEFNNKFKAKASALGLDVIECTSNQYLGGGTFTCQVLIHFWGSSTEDVGKWFTRLKMGQNRSFVETPSGGDLRGFFRSYLERRTYMPTSHGKLPDFEKYLQSATNDGQS